ncbi:hypothetical protein ATCC90586_009500 [Pythium insidiosum]|nr:hypothetical protein ATCC90586_009500 [Pythium insidiosum]
MGNQAGHELSQAEIGRRPTDREMMVLYGLQKKLFTRLVQSPEHLGLLKRYWDSHFVNKDKAPQFQPVSVFWCTEGGFSSDKPGADLRSMGELGLRSLVYFVETYPAESRMLKRAKGGYPFVKSAMAVGRALCELLHLVDEEGRPGKFPIIQTLYWQILETEESFYKLFALCFLLFEELYCDEIGRDRTLPVTEHISTTVIAQLVDAAKAKLLGTLKRAPMHLDDLRSLCLNGAQILSKSESSTAPRPKGDDALRSRSASLPSISRESSHLGAWKSHHQAKSMRLAAKSWTNDVVPADHTETRSETSSGGGVAPRLSPWSPEIARSEPQPQTADDLFAGLVTKAPPSPVAETPMEPPRSAAPAS